ncbi:ArsR/SmtB family transcription factor [Paenibacillus sp. NPDC057886]|uniref:ArsR/SmtB family transcription factor n=1 Tax=Paenibacillus sp. NPDC057886 TaxID=3346270 RepID=UPI00367985D2
MAKQDRMKRLASEFNDCQQALVAIGDQTRQSIIMALIQSEIDSDRGIRVGDLAKQTNLSRPAVSHHLKILKDANLIEVSREGTMNFYFLDITKSDFSKLRKLFGNIESFLNEFQDKSIKGE